MIDAISLSIMAVSIGAKVFTRSKIKQAEADRKDASDAYHRSYKAIQNERALSISLSNRLAVERQAAVGSHHRRIVAVTATFGVQEDFFANRGVFDGKTLAEMQGLVDGSEALFVPNTVVFGNASSIATGAAVMLNGLELADKAGLANLPLLATSLHDVVAALPLDHAAGFANALGGVGLVDVGEFFGDALFVVSAFSTIRNWTKAKDVEKVASQYRSKKWELDTKLATMTNKRQQIDTSFHKLETASYNLFTYTVVAQEAAKVQMAARSQADARPNLPQWLLIGLRRRAHELWVTVQKPAFN
jgi:hypothetical protein